MQSAFTQQSHSPDHTALCQLGRELQGTGYRFTTVSPLTHQRVNGRPANRLADDLAGVFGWNRPFQAGVIPNTLLALMQEANALETLAHAGNAATTWRSRVRFSTLHECLMVHSAYPTEAADSVFFGPDTYRFARAILAYLHQHKKPIRRAVDIGCGTGAAAILVARAYPEARVWAGDINPNALAYASINAELAGTANVIPRKSSVLDDIPGDFDLIVANPPYLNDPGRRTYRHGGGTWGEALSLKMLESALDRLAPGGSLLLYTGVAIVQGEDPFKALAVARLTNMPVHWQYEELDPDIFGEELETGVYDKADRIAAVLLTVTRTH